jgi:hypothetical protein
VTPEERCEDTYLLVSACACKKHRGGEVIERPETVGQPFEAMHEGFCSHCEHRIEVGQLIARLADDDGYVHAGGCPR